MADKRNRRQRSVVDKALDVRHVAPFSSMIGALILLLVTAIGLSTGLAPFTSGIAIAAGVVLLAYSLLLFWLQARRRDRELDGDEPIRPPEEIIEKISNPTLRDWNLTILTMSRAGLDAPLADAFKVLWDQQLFAQSQSEQPISQGPILDAAVLNSSERPPLSLDAPAVVAKSGGISREWRDSVRERIEALRTLEQGWLDGEGEEISEGVLSLGYAIGARLSTATSTTFGIFPTPDGGMQFEWAEDGTEISLEIEPDLSIELASLDSTSKAIRRERIEPQELSRVVRRAIEGNAT